VSNQFEVLSPWADIDPLPLRGISPRVTDLAGKTIGLFVDSYKGGAAPDIGREVEKQLKQKYPTAKFITFPGRELVAENKQKPDFEKWAKDIDMAISVVGD
jgi:hypothetical protein